MVILRKQSVLLAAGEGVDMKASEGGDISCWVSGKSRHSPLGKGLRQRNSRVRGAGEMESRAVLSI